MNSSSITTENNSLNTILAQILTNKFYNGPITDTYRKLISDGYLEIAENQDLFSIDFKYKTNPLENISRVVFEFTTKCNFNCIHCRNGYVKRITETNIDKLKTVVDVFRLLNINRFDFIGGEVSKYGNGWLELAKYINGNNDKIVTIYTNGWWIEEAEFEASGKFYKNDSEYLEDLKQNGVTHILFSIDGDEKMHDKSRNSIGLYHKIISSIKRIRQFGIQPRISALLYGNYYQSNSIPFAELATLIYDLPPALDSNQKLLTLREDTTNHFNNFIDIGNGVKLKSDKYLIDCVPKSKLHCKAFYRPSPGITILANGNISICPLLDASEDYGNIHEQNIIGILNNFQNAFVYKLHANKNIKDYLKYYDQNIFGRYFDHICSVRAVLTLIAKSINLENSTSDETILKINKRIAKITGHNQK